MVNCRMLSPWNKKYECNVETQQIAYDTLMEEDKYKIKVLCNYYVYYKAKSIVFFFCFFFSWWVKSVKDVQEPCNVGEERMRIKCLFLAQANDSTRERDIIGKAINCEL